jgi:hypothetical protein
MNNGTSLSAQEICTQIANLDQRRNQNLKQIMPELAELIGYGKN